MKNKSLFYVSVISWMAFIMAVSIAVPIICRPFYYAHIKPYRLVQESGYNEEQIKEAYDDMLEELMDRFGEIPAPTMNLLRIASLRTACHERYITEVTQNGDELKFVMYERSPVNVPQIEAGMVAAHCDFHGFSSPPA